MQTTTHHAEPAATKKSGFWFFVLSFLVLAIFLGMTLLFRGGTVATTDPEDIARDAVRTKYLEELQAEDTKKLTTFAWVDQAKGSVQIPISEAMKLVLVELNAQKPAPAYPILDATGQPLPATAPTNAAAPMSSTQASASVLTAPVETPAEKTAKAKKTAKPNKPQ